MIYLTLYWTFLKIGITSFGGMSMIPLISDEITSHQWMTIQEVANIVAIAQSTPGPLGINCATFVGTRVAGIAGSFCATLGVLTPSLTIGILASHYLNKLKKTSFMQQILSGTRPTCVALILTTILSLVPATYQSGASIRISSIFITGIIVFVMYKWKLSIPKIILLAAVLGLILIR